MDILGAIEHHESLATGFGALQEERQTALDEYMGEPYGDEVEGRSQVVMRDVHDTVEWIKPSLLKVFFAGDDVVKFTPVGPEDEQAAEQETEWCNHVLLRKNNGFQIINDWLHDGLLQKNGYVIASYETRDTTQLEQYRGLTDDEFTLLAQNPEVEVTEHSQAVQVFDDGYQVITHDVAVRKRTEYGCIRVRNIPPERVYVSADHPDIDLQEATFVEIVEWRSITELREEGLEVEDNISDEGGDEVYEQRLSLDEWLQDEARERTIDPASRKVRVRRVWIRFDSDGDGIAELRRVVVVGSTILEDEEDDLIPVAAWTPYRLPHEHIGMSARDAVKDLQRIRTVLVRGFLDQMYLANATRQAIDVTRVNLDDLLVTRPGGIVRVQGDPASAIMPLVQPQTGSSILEAVGYIDTVRENRTGVSRYTQGLDANVLSKTQTGVVNQMQQAANQRIELIARMFAETGMKSLMIIIHAMSTKFTRQQELVKLRNQWVPIDPRHWKSRRDMEVTVGIGTGNKDQTMAHLMMILQEQKQAMAIGLATPAHIYATMKRLTQNAGFKLAEEFWQDPATAQPQPPQIPPEVQREQLRMQAEAQKIQFQAQQDQLKAQADAELERERMAMQLQVDQNRQEYEARQQQHKAQLEAQLAAIEKESQARIEAQKLEFERWKTEYEGQVELAKTQAQIEANQQIARMKMVDDIKSAVIEEWRNTTPKIVRDETGRAVAVERGGVSRKVMRDAEGRAVGLE
jgi:hypothetical protein